MLNDDTLWWGEDIVPRIRWRIEFERFLRPKRIDEDEELPHGYGVAYYEPFRSVAVCYPVPINLIIGAFRSLMWHLRCPPWRFTEWRANMRFHDEMRHEYQRGRKDGYIESVERSTRDQRALKAQNDALFKALVEFESKLVRTVVILGPQTPQ